MKTKVIYDDNGSLSDLTTVLFSYQSGTQALSFVAAEDAIYLGSPLPFTSKYLKVTAPNSAASALSVSYWDGTAWRAVSYKNDGTATGSVSLAKSGYIAFQTDKNYIWTPDDTTKSDGTENITGLGDVTFYDQYWIKLTWSGNMSATLKWLGDVFCSDTDLSEVAPSVADTTFKTDWEAGKTDWEAQRVRASKEIIEYLQTFKLNSADLLLDKDQLTSATSYWTLSMIYSEMGDGFEEKATQYMSRSKELLKQSFDKDKNLNGRADPTETGLRIVRIVR